MSKAAIVGYADPGPLVQPVVKSRSNGGAAHLSFARRALGPIVLFAAWAGTTTLGLVDPTILPSPHVLGTAFVRLWHEQGLLHHIVVSLARAAVGALIGASVGLGLGIWAGLFRLGEELADALLQMLRTIPFLALVPLFIVWFGIDETPKLILIALATMFPMYLNTYSGVRNVDGKVLEAARSFGVTGVRLIREVVLPLALPSILTGVRFSLGVSLLVLIAAEQINATSGIGYLLNLAQVYQQVDVILICIAIYAMLGLVVDLVVRVLELLLMPWRGGIAAR